MTIHADESQFTVTPTAHLKKGARALALEIERAEFREWCSIHQDEADEPITRWCTFCGSGVHDRIPHVLSYDVCLSCGWNEFVPEPPETLLGPTAGAGEGDDGETGGADTHEREEAAHEGDPTPEPPPIEDEPPDLPSLEIRSDWSKPPPRRDFLVDSFIYRNRVAIMAGRGESGKTQMAAQLAYEVASDRSVGGRRHWFEGGPEIGAGQGIAMFASWEDDADEILRRMIGNPAYRDHGAPEIHRDLGGRFHFADMMGRGPIWAHGETYQSHGALTPTGESLQGECKARGVTLLIIDSIASAYGCDENVRPAVRHFLSSWERWAREAGCTVLMLGHPSKATEGEGSVYSGSTDWRNSVRSLLVFERAKGAEDRATLSVDKINGVKKPDKIPLGNPRWWKFMEQDDAIFEVDDAEVIQAIRTALETHGELSKRQILSAVGGNRGRASAVIDRMELSGELTMRKGPKGAHLFSITNPEADIPL